MQPQCRGVLIETRSHSVENAAVLIKLSKNKIDRVLEYKYSYTVYFIFFDF